MISQNKLRDANTLIQHSVVWSGWSPISHEINLY